MPRIIAKDEIEIEVSPDVVFGVVSDYEGISTWLPAYSCKYLNGDKARKGLKVYHQYGKLPLVRSRFTRVIDKVVPGRALEERYIDGDLEGEARWSFVKSENGTVAAYECDVTSKRLLPHITFIIFGKRPHSFVYKSLLKKLKAHCESL